MKKRKLLFFIVVTPLLMSNSPQPMPSETYYEDFTMNCELTSVLDSRYSYKISVQNNGDLYIKPGDLYVNGISIYIYDLKGLLFQNELIAPKSTLEYTFDTYSELDLSSDAKWTYSVMDLIDDNVKINDVTVEPYDPEYDSPNSYYTIKFNATGMKDYYYWSIADASYKGKDYSFFFSINYYSSFLSATEQLDLDQLTFKRFTVFRSKNNRYHLFSCSPSVS